MGSAVLQEAGDKAFVGFSPAQYELVNMVSCLRDDKDVAAFKSVLVQFLDSRLQDEIDSLCADGKLSDEQIEGFAKSHYRTPYGGSR